ncbi:MAG TPA: choline/ethanolamine kinase family protein [Streptosporangiaceae bacterium]|nr:choline/ethanolamine kinase family protein [Streptosporangiaceae bacterium]
MNVLREAGPLAVLARVPSLAGTPRQITALPGGLTNQNFKVTTSDGVFVARIFSDGGELLAIDRDQEYRNSLIAAAAGVGAPVIEYCPADRVLVLGFIDGKTLTNADVAEPATLVRIASACRRLHRAARFTADFDMFEIQPRYYATATAAGMRVPAGYADLMPAFDAARRALAVRDEGTVPCNNDLLAANFIDDGDRIWLIDYEYSGNNDPCFELGNVAGECGLDDDALAALVTAYYGQPRRSRIARAKLFSLVARYGWTLWGAIQHAGSELDFDFWSWAMERYEAAAAGFRSPEFDSLLTDVQAEG